MISEASGRAWRGCQGIYSCRKFRANRTERKQKRIRRGAQSDYEQEIEEDRIFPRKVRRETCAKSAKPTIALFFRAAFVHLTMLQSTPACTVLRPPFLVLLSIVAPRPPLYLHWRFSFCRLLVASPLLSFLPVASTRTSGPSFRTLCFLPPRCIHLPTASVVHHPLVLGAADGWHNAQCIFVIKI